jgi:SAM-dependent methyltransferase
MWTDVVDLRDFYATSLGQVAIRMVRRRMRLIWPDLTGQRLLGLGYAIPYLRPFADEAERVIAVMAAQQGVLPWPLTGPNQVALADEADLPLPDLSMDRVLLVHAVECSEQLRSMLREVWRVLADGGRILVVVPNRRGIWAQMERTPFGFGHPYTVTQLSRLLRDCLFTPVSAAGALFVPPSHSRMMLASASAWENIGDRWSPRFAGVNMIEATKQIYAAAPANGRLERRPVYVPARGSRRSLSTERVAISAETPPDGR